MIKRFAVLVTSLTLLASLGMATIASGLVSRHGHDPGVLRLTSDAPDQVIQWNQELLKVLVAPGAHGASIHPTRTLAITQIELRHI